MASHGFLNYQRIEHAHSLPSVRQKAVLRGMMRYGCDARLTFPAAAASLRNRALTARGLMKEREGALRGLEIDYRNRFGIENVKKLIATDLPPPSSADCVQRLIALPAFRRRVLPRARFYRR